MAEITKTIANRLSGGMLNEQATQIVELTEAGNRSNLSLEIVQESLHRLEQALNTREWRTLTMSFKHEFTRQGLIDITNISRIMRIKNPLIFRGVEIQRLYVWAQGVTVSAHDDDIGEMVDDFVNHQRNAHVIGSHQARGDLEIDLQQDGNIFFRFFVNSTNGRVRIRKIDPNQIKEIICNPEDESEPWFYRRMWSKKNMSGGVESAIAYYPDFNFNPRTKTGFDKLLASSGGHGGHIEWDTPVYHIATNKVGNWGVSEFYSANDWAVAYKNFLEQLASVWSALARWAAKLTVKGGRTGVAAAKSKLGTTLGASHGGDDTNPPPVTGSVFIQSEGNDLQPFRTAGATMSADDGRRLMLMAQMVFGFPETFYGDSTAGSLATAKSLDRPTELKILDRQELWKSVYKNILLFVATWAIKAPNGALSGLANIEQEIDGRQVNETIIWDDDIDPVIDVVFPSIIEHDIDTTIGALVKAQTLEGKPVGAGIPLETAVFNMLSELGIDHIPEVMDIWREDQLSLQAASDATANEAPANEAWDRQVTAVSNLLDGLQESMAQDEAD